MLHKHETKLSRDEVGDDISAACVCELSSIYLIAVFIAEVEMVSWQTRNSLNVCFVLQRLQWSSTSLESWRSHRIYMQGPMTSRSAAALSACRHI